MMFLLLLKTTRMKLGLPLLAPIPSSSSSFVGSHEPPSNNEQVMIPFSRTLKLAVIIKVCVCSGIDGEDGGRIGWWARKEEKKQEEEEQEY